MSRQQADTTHAEAPGVQKPWYQRWWAIALSVLLIIGIVGSFFADGEEEEDTALAEPSPSSQEDAGAVAETSEEGVDPLEAEVQPAEDREFRPSQQVIAGGDGVETRYLSGEDGAGVEVHHLHCEDSEALTEKAEHNGDSQPVGWPQGWDGTGAMPDPYCHPDYLEIGEWDHLEAHSACWEGNETSTLVAQGQPQDEINKVLWQQSQARADWEQNPPGGTCAEQWAEHDGGEPEDYADRGNADHG